MYEVKLSGPYYDMGLEIGKTLEKDKGLLPEFSKENLVKGMTYEREVRNVRALAVSKHACSNSYYRALGN